MCGIVVESVDMRERGGSVSHVQVGWRYKSRVRGVQILICDFAQIAAHRFFVWFGARQLSLGDAQLSLNAMSHGDCYLQFGYFHIRQLPARASRVSTSYCPRGSNAHNSRSRTRDRARSWMRGGRPAAYTRWRHHPDKKFLPARRGGCRDRGPRDWARPRRHRRVARHGVGHPGP